MHFGVGNGTLRALKEYFNIPLMGGVGKTEPNLFH